MIRKLSTQKWDERVGAGTIASQIPVTSPRVAWGQEHTRLAHLPLY